MHNTVLIKDETLEDSKILESLADKATIEEPKVVHEYGDWKYDDEAHWKECECGVKTDRVAHSFVWIVDKEATATAVGSRHEQCEVCGYARAAVEIPATGDQSQTTGDKTDADKVSDSDSPKTGDDTMVLGYVIMMLAALGIGGTLVVNRKKN